MPEIFCTILQFGKFVSCNQCNSANYSLLESASTVTAPSFAAVPSFSSAAPSKVFLPQPSSYEVDHEDF
jgi:hypothetical protein